MFISFHKNQRSSGNGCNKTRGELHLGRENKHTLHPTSKSSSAGHASIPFHPINSMFIEEEAPSYMPMKYVKRSLLTNQMEEHEIHINAPG
jgi:hypothetical protein